MSKPYDIVIIGSGMGGLCCAYILSKEGLNVCVLEKNRQLGGNLQVFSRNKAIFDTGIHYLGGLDEGQNLNQYFKYFGLMKKLKLMRLDEDGYDHITFRGDKNVYKHAQGFDTFVETLAEQFPGERENLQRYVDKIRHICDFFPLYRIRMERKEVSGADFLETDTKAYLETITSNKKLQNVLAGSNALYAGVADKTPLYVHAMVINSYIESSYKCIDGSGQIAKHLADSIKQMGGTIINYSEAKQFHFSGDKIKEVELTDGRKIEGKNFISNIDISRTLDMIEPGHVRTAYRNRINSLENTTSVFILYVTLKPGSLKYFNYNMYHHHVDDAWAGVNYTPGNFPHGMAVFSQYSSRHPEHTDSLIAMAYMNYSEMEKWKDTVNIIPNHETGRGADYEAFKQEKSEKMIAALEERMPGIKEKITGYWSSTPLTYRDYIGSRDGNLYGIAKDYRNPLRTFITPKTKIPNLLLTGQNINFHGVLGVTVSSVVTCAELVGHENIVKQIQTAV